MKHRKKTDSETLSLGELNRSLVGKTEKLLVDMMYRPHTIPFLICSMTVDEINGLVLKRDNDAQQSKVDGITVLLSHIKDIKDIPNLIIFGVTNRRNKMNEALVRSMQAKVFVGLPSPSIRKNMLSDAAVSALRSSIIVEMDRHPNIHHRRLLELADSVARDHNVWFGIVWLNCRKMNQR